MSVLKMVVISALCLSTVGLGACGAQSEVAYQTVHLVVEPRDADKLTIYMEVGDILQGNVRVQGWPCITIIHISNNETSTNIISISLIDSSNREVLSKRVLRGFYDFCYEASTSGIYTMLFDNTLCHLYRQYIVFYHAIRIASLD